MHNFNTCLVQNEHRKMHSTNSLLWNTKRSWSCQKSLMLGQLGLNAPLLGKFLVSLIITNTIYILTHLYNFISFLPSLLAVSLFNNFSCLALPCHAYVIVSWKQNIYCAAFKRPSKLIPFSYIYGCDLILPYVLCIYGIRVLMIFLWSGSLWFMLGFWCCGVAVRSFLYPTWHGMAVTPYNCIHFKI